MLLGDSIVVRTLLKIRVISTRREIDELSRDEQIVHLAFRASNADIFRLLQKCPRIKAIQLPASYRRTISQAAEMFLDMQGVVLIEGDVWGHRKDISEYFMVNDSVSQRIGVMNAEGLSPEAIAEAVSSETSISPNLVRYVISQAR